MSHIQVKNLSVHYDDCCALNDVNFEAKKGEFVAIVGKSGSGKTTFLHALANFIPFSGQVTIPKTVGVVFQQYAVFPWFTASENIAFGLENYNSEKQQQIIQEHLKLAELEDKKDKYPGELSGGQVQRVALARSLAHNPEVLLMDEPYGALDAYTREKMQQWLLDVWMTCKKTIVFVTHNIEEAMFLADRVLVLSNKRFIKELKVPFARPRQEEVKFTPEFNELRKEILRSINSAV
ncbi:ABC transporter ATP-binding protein [Patescibacteria group bacterium]|nr:ABC transporter ATP-binding protein [Patescibacteria group bacterium]